MLFRMGYAPRSSCDTSQESHLPRGHDAHGRVAPPYYVPVRANGRPPPSRYKSIKNKNIFYSSNFRYRPSTFPFLGHLRPCSAPRLYVAGPLLRLPPVPSGAIPPIHAFPFFSYPRPLPFLAPASRDGENVPVKNVPVKTTLRFGPHMLKSEVRDRPSERNTPIKTPLRSWSSSNTG